MNHWPKFVSAPVPDGSSWADPRPRAGANPERIVSVVIPAFNEEAMIGRVVEAVFAQAVPGRRLEVVVVDDGSTDRTREVACAAGARVLRRDAGGPGNPGACRNIGARGSRGDPIVFLDADCVPAPGWLAVLLRTHERGAAVAGGSLAMPPGLSATARVDYYCSWYLVHPAARGGAVPHHPPPNLSVTREAFLATEGFSEEPPLSYSDEQRSWQGRVLAGGGTIVFEPDAVVYHFHHRGVSALLRRHYRWGYPAVQSKAISGAARVPWLYRRSWLLILASPALPLLHTGFVLFCWLRVRRLEPVLLLPLVLLSSFAYTLGLVRGCVAWWAAGRPGSQPRGVRVRAALPGPGAARR